MCAFGDVYGSQGSVQRPNCGHSYSQAAAGHFQTSAYAPTCVCQQAYGTDLVLLNLSLALRAGLAVDKDPVHVLTLCTVLGDPRFHQFAYDLCNRGMNIYSVNIMICKRTGIQDAPIACTSAWK